jgi:RNA polymerase sigma-70 factor, ECF subfamily
MEPGDLSSRPFIEPAKMAEMASLTELFDAHRSAPAGAAGPAMEAALIRRIEDARNAFPSVELDPEIFVRYLAERIPSDTEDPAAALEGMQTTDLFLACACAEGSPTALAALDQLVQQCVTEGVRRLDSSHAFAADVAQALRERLLVGPSPKIRSYSGSGPLGHWLRASAFRAAVDLLRAAGKEEVVAGVATEASALGDDPELDYLKRHYRKHFKAAFEDALEALEPRERTVLRLQVIEGLSTDQIGGVYRVHRVTVNRWATAARAKLLAETRKSLGTRLGLSSGELDSLMNLVDSRLDVSLLSFLRDAPEEPDP